jgi:CRP-like cAMP-binding protein
LASSTNPLNFSLEENIIVQGDYGDSLFILTSGEVEVLIDDKLVNTLHDGDYFGEIAIIADTKRTATVRASTDCSTLKLSTKAFKELIYDNPKISLKVMKEITNRLLQNSKSN